MNLLPPTYCMALDLGKMWPSRGQQRLVKLLFLQSFVLELPHSHVFGLSYGSLSILATLLSSRWFGVDCQERPTT